MDLDLPQGSGRVVPQAKSGGGGGGGGMLAKLGAIVAGAYTQTLRSQNQLAMEYQREIIRSAGDKTRHDNRFEFQQNVLNDQQRRREDGTPIEQAFGVRYKSNYKQTPNPDKTKTGTPPKGGKGGKTPTPGKMKEIGIGEAEEALKLSKGVGGRKPTKKQKLSDTYEITDTTTGKSRTVKDPAKNLGIDQETVADSSPRYAAKLGRKAAAKAAKNNPNPDDGGNGNKK